MSKPPEGKSIIHLPKLSRADSNQQLTYKETLGKLRESMRSSKLNMLEYLQKTARRPSTNKNSPLFASFKRKLLEPISLPVSKHRRTLSLEMQEPERQLTIYSKFNRKLKPAVHDTDVIREKLRFEKQKQLEQHQHMQRVLDSTLQLFDSVQASPAN